MFRSTRFLLILLILWVAALSMRIVVAAMPVAGVWESGDPSVGVVEALASEPGLLLAGTGTGLYQSTDGGAGWALVPVVANSRITAVTAGEGRAYAAGPDGWWERADGEWKRVEPASGSETRGLAAISGRLLAATDEGLFERAMDGHGRWQRLWPSSDAAPAAAFTVLVSGGTVWIGTADGVVERDVQGESWRGIGPAGARVLGLSAGGGWLHAAVGAPDGGLFRTRMGGSDWKKADVSTLEATTVLVAHLDPARVYAGLSGLADATRIAGVVVSEDGGTSWTPVRSRLLNSRVPALALDPASSTLYAGTNGGGVFRYRIPSPLHRAFDVVEPGLEWVEPALLGLLVLALLLRTRSASARRTGVRAP